MNILTLKQAIELFSKGEIIMIVEFRSARIDTINWRDQETQNRMTARILKITTECANQTVIVTQNLDSANPDEANDEKALATLPFKKGDAAILRPTQLQSQRGVLTARGTLAQLAK